MTEVGARIGDERFEERDRHGVEAFERPQAAHAGGDRLGRIGGPLFEHGHERLRLAIDDLLPSEVGDPGVGSAEMLGQLFRGQLPHGHGLAQWLRGMPDPPDPAAFAVAVGMVARHLVVRDDLVVPIDHIQAAVGAKLRGHGAERLIATDEKIRPLAIGGALARACRDDRLDLVGDRVGEVEDPLPGRRSGARAPRPRPAVGIVGDGEAAQAAASHLRRPERGRHHGLIGAEPIGGAGCHEHARLVREDRVSDVVCFLEPDLALARDRQAPDVVRSGRERFKQRAIGPEPAELARVVSNFFGAIGKRHIARPLHGRSIEEALGQQDPIAGHPRELVREEVRILHAEAIQHGFEAVGPTVAIGVAIQPDLGAVLHEGAVAIGQHAERNREPFGKHPRS